MSNNAITTESLIETITAAHDRGWSSEQIATILASWLRSLAGQTLNMQAPGWENPEDRRVAANWLSQLADEVERS